MGEPMRPVVVGVDGSAESLSALDLAAHQAPRRAAPLTIVHIDDPSAAGRARLLAAATSRALAEHPALAVAGELLSGAPADVLVGSHAGRAYW